MLVKIIAAGLAPPVWKNVFQELRALLTEQPFSVGMFATREELAFLMEEFYPRQWQRESPDFLLWDAAAQHDWEAQRPFLAGVGQLAAPPALALACKGLERTLKELLTVHGELSLDLDTAATFTLTDPSFLVGEFPARFPRIKVNSRLTTVRMRPGAGRGGEIDPSSLADGTLVGFSELDAILLDEKIYTPKEWLKQVYREADIKRPPRTAGLIKEARGLFLFPGVPLPHVRGVGIDGVRFSHLLDLEQLHGDATQFAAFAQAVHKTGQRRLRAWKAHTAKIREAEAKADIPIACGGDNELLRESLAALLTRLGHHRCFTLDAPAEGVFREPSLLLQVSPWQRGRLGAQADSPLVLDVAEELEACMQPLERMLPWRELAYQPPPVDIPPLPREQFAQQRKRLAGRATRLRSRFGQEEKRDLLMIQEVQVLLAARDKLAQLLDAGETVQLWPGEPLAAGQLLLFSYDQEEAAAVMRSLPGIAKKRWVDLAPFEEPDRLQNLDLEELRPYAECGAMRITEAAWERLENQREQALAALDQAQQDLEAGKAAMENLGVELKDVVAAQEKLAHHWTWVALGQWLKDNRGRMARALETLRERHERRWFSRSQVRRALIFPGQPDNAPALLEACGQVYPGFSRDHSVVVPYEYEFLDALPEEDAAAIQKEGREEGLAPGGIADRLSQALTRKNEALFADFLQVVSNDLAGMRTDLVLIEHRPEIASRILEHVRRAAPRLEHVPAVLILSELWAPPPNKPLPWPRTRVALLPRMGSLSAEDCAEHLGALYSM